MQFSVMFSRFLANVLFCDHETFMMHYNVMLHTKQSDLLGTVSQCAPCVFIASETSSNPCNPKAFCSHLHVRYGHFGVLSQVAQNHVLDMTHHIFEVFHGWPMMSNNQPFRMTERDIVEFIHSIPEPSCLCCNVRYTPALMHLGCTPSQQGTQNNG